MGMKCVRALNNNLTSEYYLGGLVIYRITSFSDATVSAWSSEAWLDAPDYSMQLIDVREAGDPKPNFGTKLLMLLRRPIMDYNVMVAIVVPDAGRHSLMRTITDCIPLQPCIKFRIFRSEPAGLNWLRYLAE